MDRFEREELGTLFVVAINSARDEMAALYAHDLDMAVWTCTADTAHAAIREFWTALYRLEVKESSERVHKNVTARSSGQRTSK